MKQILIAHRGNINGPNPLMENNPIYIQQALNKGYHVEVDVWLIKDTLMLGHDAPQYTTSLDFLKIPNLWIHCKDYKTLQFFVLQSLNLNYFYHTNEDYVLTSHNYIWAYPGLIGDNKTICVLPEMYNQDTTSFYGICSDFIENYYEADFI